MPSFNEITSLNTIPDMLNIFLFISCFYHFAISYDINTFTYCNGCLFKFKLQFIMKTSYDNKITQAWRSRLTNNVLIPMGQIERPKQRFPYTDSHTCTVWRGKWAWMPCDLMEEWQKLGILPTWRSTIFRRNFLPENYVWYRKEISQDLYASTPKDNR